MIDQQEPANPAVIRNALHLLEFLSEAGQDRGHRNGWCETCWILYAQGSCRYGIDPLEAAIIAADAGRVHFTSEGGFVMN